jgi:hypothetical protein
MDNYEKIEKIGEGAERGERADGERATEETIFKVASSLSPCLLAPTACKPRDGTTAAGDRGVVTTSLDERRRLSSAAAHAGQPKRERQREAPSAAVVAATETTTTRPVRPLIITPSPPHHRENQTTGTYGKVYKAKDKTNGKVVALKKTRLEVRVQQRSKAAAKVIVVVAF